MPLYRQNSSKIILGALTVFLLATAPFASQASTYPDHYAKPAPPRASNSSRPPLPPPEDGRANRPPSPNVSQQKAQSHPEYRVHERQGWDDRHREDFRPPHHDKNGFEKRPPAKPHAKPHKPRHKDKDRDMRRPPKHDQRPDAMRKPPQKPEHIKAPKPPRDKKHKDRHSKKRK